MVKMQQQSFAAIQKTQTKKVVVDKREPGPDHDVDYAESRTPLRHGHFRAQRRIAIHVIDVIGKGRVGVMKNCAMLKRGSVAADFHRLVYGAVFNPAATAAEQAQLRIRPEASVPDPSSQEMILPRNRNARNFPPIQSASSACAPSTMKG